MDLTQHHSSLNIALTVNSCLVLMVNKCLFSATAGLWCWLTYDVLQLLISLSTMICSFTVSKKSCLLDSCNNATLADFYASFDYHNV